MATHAPNGIQCVNRPESNRLPRMEFWTPFSDRFAELCCAAVEPKALESIPSIEFSVIGLMADSSTISHAILSVQVCSRLAISGNSRFSLSPPHQLKVPRNLNTKREEKKINGEFVERIFSPVAPPSYFHVGSGYSQPLIYQNRD